MVRGDITIRIPNPHQADIGMELLARILRQASISREEWEALQSDSIWRRRANARLVSAGDRRAAQGPADLLLQGGPWSADSHLRTDGLRPKPHGAQPWRPLPPVGLRKRHRTSHAQPATAPDHRYRGHR